MATLAPPGYAYELCDLRFRDEHGQDWIGLDQD